MIDFYFTRLERYHEEHMTEDDIKKVKEKTKKQVQIYAQYEFDDNHMFEIRNALQQGWSKKDILELIEKIRKTY